MGHVYAVVGEFAAELQLFRRGVSFVDERAGQAPEILKSFCRKIKRKRPRYPYSLYQESN
eukprot:1494153-Rhodomonas_salina.2